MIDLIICAFSNPSPATVASIKSGPIPNNKDFFLKDKFKTNLKIVDVPFSIQAGEGNVSPAYRRTAQKYIQSGGILKNIIQSKVGTTEKIRSAAIITFSGGTAFAKELIKTEDAKYIDTWITLDGLHFSADYKGEAIPQEVEPWGKLALEAMNYEKMFINSHTNIKLTGKEVLDTTASANAILKYGGGNIPVESNEPIPGYNEKKWQNLKKTTPGEVTIRGGNPVATNTRSAELNANPAAFTLGDFYSIQNYGTQGTDHIYNATYGLAEAMSMLSERWQLPTTCTQVSGIGDDGEVCKKYLKTIPSSYQVRSYDEFYTYGYLVGLGLAATYLFGGNYGKS